jgi:hypothetical protein
LFEVVCKLQLREAFKLCQIKPAMANRAFEVCSLLSYVKTFFLACCLSVDYLPGSVFTIVSKFVGSIVKCFCHPNFTIFIKYCSCDFISGNAIFASKNY